jgi:L-lactate dehydrogenase complex protein LldG
LPTAADNPARERILEKIRAGLRTKIDSLPPSAIRYEDIFEPVTNPRERFESEATANLMECIATPDPAASAEQLAVVLASLPEGEIYVQDTPALRRLVEESNTQRPVRWSSEGAPAESSQATISLAEALVAQTGSIFVTAACGGRGASVVAPCHIVFATTDQIVPDLETALSTAHQQGRLTDTSYGCMISGSSRTADIEKILVQGAHGPRRLVVILQATR